jgi:hypothetical protein
MLSPQRGQFRNAGSGPLIAALLVSKGPEARTVFTGSHAPDYGRLP